MPTSRQQFLERFVCVDTLSCLLYRLEENGVLTDCSIRTQEPEETLDFDFCSAKVINKAILKVEIPLALSPLIQIDNRTFTVICIDAG